MYIESAKHTRICDIGPKAAVRTLAIWQNMVWAVTFRRQGLGQEKAPDFEP